LQRVLAQVLFRPSLSGELADALLKPASIDGMRRFVQDMLVHIGQRHTKTSHPDYSPKYSCLHGNACVIDFCEFVDDVRGGDHGGREAGRRHIAFTTIAHSPIVPVTGAATAAPNSNQEYAADPKRRKHENGACGAFGRVIRGRDDGGHAGDCR
jgi:hypothetical protein